jgi:hypothetical protein
MKHSNGSVPIRLQKRRQVYTEPAVLREREKNHQQDALPHAPDLRIVEIPADATMYRVRMMIPNT